MIQRIGILLLVAGLVTPPEGSAQSPEKDAAFPSSWLGSWKGPSEVIRGGRVAMKFPMELHIEPMEGDGRFAWRIVYGEGERRQVRPYEIETVDAAKGHFRIDEKNSIVLDSYFENENLRSRFWVADNVIEATYARDGDTMIVTMTTFGAKPVTMTGGEGRVPPVASYGLRSVQRAVLKRSE